MPIKLVTVTEQEIRDIKVPTGKNILEYGEIIDKIKIECIKMGYSPNNYTHEYRTTNTGNIVQGTMIIDEISKGVFTCICWSSSYDKTNKFKLGIGIMNSLTGSNIMNYRDFLPNRSTPTDTAIFITSELYQIGTRVNNIQETIDRCSGIVIDAYEFGSIVGQLYVNEKVLNISQVANVSTKTPILLHNSLLSAFSSISSSIQDSHPSVWMDNNNNLYKFMEDRSNRKSIVEIKTTKKEPTMSSFKDYFPIEPRGSINSVQFV